ncbi:hypothetical protein GOBAR_DD31055 [Gossypium barbadense]|nr:hypothetical protein GOBAR_DD31055 [Gossypium barbadense]
MGKGSKRKHQKKIDESIDSESETQSQGLTTLLDPPKPKKARKVVPDSDLCLVGPPIAPAEARQRWPHRYQSKNDSAAKESRIPDSGLYYNMKYSLQHLTFKNIFTEISKKDSGTSSVVSSECGSNNTSSEVQRFDNSQKYLLDLYSGCGAMSTGLCMGASLAGIKLVTKWAVDINSFACKSLQWNHPETKAEDGNLDYIARIVEFFETVDQEPFFKAQWFYRAEDTVRTIF